MGYFKITVSEDDFLADRTTRHEFLVEALDSDVARLCNGLRGRATRLGRVSAAKAERVTFLQPFDVDTAFPPLRGASGGPA
jgi:hypothetical protein